MLTSLGRATADESLVGLLTACHARIRSFADLAIAIAAPEARSRPPGELAEAAAAVHRYFAVALPLHVADEDASLAPRLFGHSPAVDEALARMQVEHVEHAPLLARLCELTTALASDPTSHPDVAPALTPLAAELRAAFEVHLTLEESAIFPALDALPAATQAVIVAELRERRA